MLHERSPDGAARWWKVFLAALEKLKENAAGLSLAAEANRSNTAQRLARRPEASPKPAAVVRATLSPEWHGKRAAALAEL